MHTGSPPHFVVDGNWALLRRPALCVRLPGAFALDERDGEVEVRVVGLPLDLQEPTKPGDRGQVLAYTAVDAAGNNAEPVYREVRRGSNLACLSDVFPHPLLTEGCLGVGRHCQRLCPRDHMRRAAGGGWQLLRGGRVRRHPV